MVSIISLCLIDIAKSQDTVLAITCKGRLDSLDSRILNQKRLIQVFVPSGFKAGSTDKYDVIYVLDGGNWNTGLITRIQNFVEKEGQMPPVIIVSILGIDRNLDLTPTHLDSWQAASGGAGNFLSFIKKELIPYIDANYPSNGINTLWGHSLGGMFVVYALVNEPAAFKSYIAVDPSLWWDKCYVPRLAAANLPELNGSGTTLFISGREGLQLHEMRIDTMDIVLKEKAPPSLKWKVLTYSDETHSSLRFKSTYDGLKYTYAGYSTGIEFHPMNGTLQKDKPIKILYSEDTTRVHYTIDGTIPTELSPAVHREITLTGPAVVTYKRFCNRSNYDQTVTGIFTTGEVPLSVSRPKNSSPGGFDYAYYEGDFNGGHELKNLTPLRTGIINKDFNPSDLPRKENYALVINGLLQAEEDGYYTFFMRAGERTKIYLGGKLLMQRIVDSDHQICSYILPLSKGFYPIMVEYFDKKDVFNLLLYYITPSAKDANDPVPIPPEVQYNIGKP